VHKIYELENRCIIAFQLVPRSHSPIRFPNLKSTTLLVFRQRPSMRVSFALLLATTLLANGETATTSSETMQLTDAVHSVGVIEARDGRRFLRLANPIKNDDVEERAWATIKGISRTKAEAVENWLTPRLQSRWTPEKLAKSDLDIVAKETATEHENWNALVKYVKMLVFDVTKQKISKKEAKDLILTKILTQANGF
ncbi:hypothetical protein L916_19901, partial [Phytophthora nicotianae]